MRLWPFGPIFRWGWQHRTGPKDKFEGFFLADAAQIKQAVKIPVLVTGGFQTASVIAQGIREGKCDGVTIARPLIANPDLVQMFASGIDHPQNECTLCNNCLIESLTSPLGCYD